jgi:UPF0716 protein FxsA
MSLLVVMLAVPLIEIVLFILIGGAIGVWWTLAWILATAFLGIVVLKGIATTGGMTISQDMRDLTNPLSPLAHRGMVTIGGTLLIVPGFLTDAIGLLLLVPALRTMIIKLVGRRFTHSLNMRGTTVVDAEWTELDSDGTPRSKKTFTDPTRH